MLKLAQLFVAAVILSAVAVAEDFTFIALPDTQHYSQDNPAIFSSQSQWTVDNAAAQNIRFVTHLGDIVHEAATLGEWENARAAMDILDAAGMPYGTACGNHDIRYPGSYYDPDGDNYLYYFGPQHHAGQPWFGGASPSGLSNYQLVTVGDRSYLFLHLLVETPANELAWAQTVLNAHRDKPTFVTTHRYLFDWRVLGSGRYGDFEYTFEPLYRDDGIKADDFFYNFVAPNRQILMIMCGHCDGEHNQTSVNAAGLPVHELLADYQTTFGAGGNGWMRLMKVRPESDRIEVRTYSPWLNDWRTGSESQFDLVVDLDAYAVGSPVLCFQQGVSGYSGTQDTWINEDEPGSSYGGSSVITVDDDTTNGWWGYDYQGQGLLRFDGLLQGPVYEGDPAPTAIPLGATITNASLTINLSNDCDLCGPEFYLYRLTRDWSESSTWNSLGSGIVAGDDTDPTLVASFNGDNEPDYEWFRTMNVTSAVAAWSAGAPNYGFAILPQRVSGCDDGIDIRSSEDGTPSLRPALTVEFTYDVINVLPTIVMALQASELDVPEGRQVEFTASATDPNPLDPLVLRLNGSDVAYATGSGDFSYWMTMPDEGTYVMTAEVCDDVDCVHAGGPLTITVHNVPPTIDSLTPDLVVFLNEQFTFEAAASDPGPDDLLTYAWDLDADGLYDDHAGPTGMTSFAATGQYVISVEVADDDGGVTHGDLLVDVIGRPGDMNCDGAVDVFDINPFVTAILDPARYATTFPACDIQHGDINGDTLVDVFDINPFVDLILGQ